KQLQVPYSFTRPAVLFGVEGSLIRQANNEKDQQHFELRVEIDQALYVLNEEYQGNAVWIGCGKDELEVPQHVRDAWKDELQEPVGASHLLQPVALVDKVSASDRDGLLRINLSGKCVRVLLYKQGASEAFRHTPVVVVRDVRGSLDVVQPLLLRDV